jgi:hypothetical protein
MAEAKTKGSKRTNSFEKKVLNNSVKISYILLKLEDGKISDSTNCTLAGASARFRKNEHMFYLPKFRVASHDFKLIFAYLTDNQAIPEDKRYLGPMICRSELENVPAICTVFRIGDEYFKYEHGVTGDDEVPDEFEELVQDRKQYMTNSIPVYEIESKSNSSGTTVLNSRRTGENLDLTLYLKREAEQKKDTAKSPTTKSDFTLHQLNQILRGRQKGNSSARASSRPRSRSRSRSPEAKKARPKKSASAEEMVASFREIPNNESGDERKYLNITNLTSSLTGKKTGPPQLSTIRLFPDPRNQLYNVVVFNLNKDKKANRESLCYFLKDLMPGATEADVDAVIDAALDADSHVKTRTVRATKGSKKASKKTPAKASKKGSKKKGGKKKA